MELSYIFLKKVFLIFRERYIQSPGIFRILVYSEHCQTSMMEHFAKSSYVAHFSAPPSKFFPEKISYIFSKKFFSYLEKMEFYSPKIRKFLILPSPSMLLKFFTKKTCSVKVSYSFKKQNFSYNSGKVYSEP